MTWHLMSPASQLLRMIDSIYPRLNRLRPVGRLLYIQESRYAGPMREFANGVCLESGQSLGILHLNNRGLQDAQSDSKAGAFVFARLMLDSLADLAEAVECDPDLSHLVAFYGVTWIPPHGRRLGFETAMLPDTWRNRLRGRYFRLLLFAFNPDSSRRFRTRLQPYEFWLSRKHLLDRFSTRNNRR